MGGAYGQLCADARTKGRKTYLHIEFYNLKLMPLFSLCLVNFLNWHRQHYQPEEVRYNPQTSNIAVEFIHRCAYFYPQVHFNYHFQTFVFSLLKNNAFWTRNLLSENEPKLTKLHQFFKKKSGGACPPTPPPPPPLKQTRITDQLAHPSLCFSHAHFFLFCSSCDYELQVRLEKRFESWRIVIDSTISLRQSRIKPTNK